MTQRPLISLLREKREEILRIAAEHGAYNVRVFGSVARGEETEDSDVDLLVEVSEKRSSWFPVDLILALEDLLGKKVDVVNDKAIYWLLEDRIKNSTIQL